MNYKHQCSIILLFGRFGQTIFLGFHQALSIWSTDKINYFIGTTKIFHIAGYIYYVLTIIYLFHLACVSLLTNIVRRLLFLKRS